MGSKRQLAPQIAEIIANLRNGPILDLFSGMCAVASKIGPSRQVWCNDIQHFSYLVAKQLFTSSCLSPEFSKLEESALFFYLNNMRRLKRRFQEKLNIENNLIEVKDFQGIREFYELLPYVNKSRYYYNERIKLNNIPKAFPYRLFSITFAGGYFGLSQCVQIDSIRYSCDQLLESQIITLQEFNWLLLALCVAIGKSATNTGHFAQFLKINNNNYKEYLAKRNTSMWNEWLRAIKGLSPVGNSNWRINNKVFRDNALHLLRKLYFSKELPGIIYADPPYTADQYSRYYHLYETLIKYDYPVATGAGRYRSDRFTSTFSLKSKVYKSLQEMIRASSSLGSYLVISYPQNGLLDDSKSVIMALLKQYYNRAEVVKLIPFRHSSLGASKGIEKYNVSEMIYLAR